MDFKAEQPNRRPGPEAIEILIVEDEMLIALAASATLSELGHRITGIVRTAAAALASAAERRPDLVLMDITLRGDIGGLEAARLLRERFDLPILFVTAHADEVTMKRAEATGSAGYLLKPYTPQQLCQAVERAYSVACKAAERPDRARTACGAAAGEGNSSHDARARGRL